MSQVYSLRGIMEKVRKLILNTTMEFKLLDATIDSH